MEATSEVMALRKGFENIIDNEDRWFSDLELRVLDLEQEVSEWRESRTRGLAEPGREPETGFERDGNLAVGHTTAFPRGGTGGRGPRQPRRATRTPEPQRYPDERRPPGDRTRTLIDRGRRTARRPRRRLARKIVIVPAAGLAVLITGAMIVFRHGPSWPASVATVKSQIAIACQNPDVVSEPSQVNFACGQDTSQILWVFALMTSHDNPGYSDPKTGRAGLEPITPAQGGQLAWSLNLHHPYDPFNAVDSLAVAARAINNIIGGATLTAANGNPAVQPGLESNPANCARYTGSSAIITHAGYPSLCASPVASPAGEAALTADVYQKWMVGATSVAARDVSVLFENAGDPGDPRVQAILKTLPGPRR